MSCVSGSSSQYSRRSLDETSALLPIEMNAESPRLRSAAFSSSARPRAPLCEENPIDPGGRARGPNVAFRRGAADGDAEAIGADESPAASADEREEPILALAPLAADLGEPCRDHAERAHARREGRLGCVEHVRTGKTDDRQVDDLRHVFESPVRAHAGNRLAGAVQGIRGAGELGVEHVSEEAPADRLRTWGGADDRDAHGREEGAERRDDGEMVPLVDVREVLRGCGDRKGDLDRSPVEHARDREAGCLEDVQHRLVLGHHLGDEALDSDLGRACRELLQEPRADASPLVAVGNRERSFGGRWVA